MVGDRCFDIEGGQVNGVDTIGVCYGYGTEDELTAARRRISRTTAELENILLGDAPRARGVFISMEGVDGCGKTTQRAALTDHLQKLGWRVTQTREPGGDAVAEKIRELVPRSDEQGDVRRDGRPICTRPAARRMSARWFARRSFAATRWCAIGLSIPPWPIRARGGSWAWRRSRRSTRWRSAEPCRISPCICACPPTRRFSRRLSASEPDRLERQKADFFSRTGQAYERLFAGQEKRVMTVNAAQSIERVTQEMLDGLDERLNRLDV